MKRGFNSGFVRSISILSQALCLLAVCAIAFAKILSYWPGLAWTLNVPQEHAFLTVNGVNLVVDSLSSYQNSWVSL